MNTDQNGQVERIDIPDDTVIFGLPGGRGDFECSPLDTVVDLDAIQDALAADQGKTMLDYYRAVAQYVVERGEPGRPLMTLGQARDFNHALRKHVVEKKRKQNDDMLAALESPSFTDSTPAN